MPNNRLTTTARNLRQNQTDAEKLLWSKLRNRQLEGEKFVRQFPIGPFVADFVCRALMLVIELDGGQLADNSRDAQRTAVIEGLGYRVIRFWNNDVLSNPEGVLHRVVEAVRLARVAVPLTPTLSPRGEGEESEEPSPLRERVG